MTELQTGRADQVGAEGGPTVAYSVKSAAQAAGSSRSEIYRLLAAGRLKAKKSGRKTLIPTGELHRWLNDLPDYVPQGAPQRAGAV